MKKKLVTILGIMLSVWLYGQSPGKFKYQTVIRDNSGELIQNQNVRFRISILESNQTGSQVFQEIHNVTSNNYGVCNLVIGNGTDQVSSLDAIGWGENDYFLKVELDETGGSDFSEMGIVQLLSVPYAMYSNSANSANSANYAISAGESEKADTAEFASNSVMAEMAINAQYADSARTSGMANNAQYADSARISGIANKAKLADSALVSEMAYNANMAEYANEAYLANVLGSNSVYTTNSDTLFVVKDHEGNVVFAVYPDGAKIYVNQQQKGKIGGFAVSGRNPAKANEEDIFVVTKDSTRIYVSDTTVAKGKIGGFAVSGRNPAKGMVSDYLQVTKDSTRIYYNESQTKGKVGGFAVSGRNPAKAGTSSLLDLTKENYFIGHSAGENNIGGLRNFFAGYESGMMNTEGDYNVAMGYQAGRNNVDGFYNVFIGYQAGLNSNTASNVFIGQSAGLNTTDGWSNVFIGQVAGRDNTTGVRNVMIGRDAGSSTQSSDNTFVGTFTGANMLTGSDNVFVGIEANSNGLEGYNNVYVGGYAGYSNNGSRNVILGRSAGPNSHDYTTQSDFNNSVMIGYQSGYNNKTGNGNVFIGYQAGYDETGSDVLVIGNSSANELITGDFADGQVGINGTPSTTSTNILRVYSGSTNGYYSSSGWSHVSDKRLKTNIVSVDNALNKVLQMEGVYFNWIADPGKKQVGFIAQEMQNILPEVVGRGEDDYLTITYDNVVPVLVNATKEQQSQIELLKNENKELKQMILNLKKEVDLLKSK